jgi:hypothetical protein
MTPQHLATAALTSLAFVACLPPAPQTYANAWAEPAGGEASLPAPTFRFENDLRDDRCTYIDVIEVIDVEADFASKATAWCPTDAGPGGDGARIAAAPPTPRGSGVSNRGGGRPNGLA